MLKSTLGFVALNRIARDNKPYSTGVQMAEKIETTEEYKERDGVIERLPRFEDWEINQVRPKGESLGEGCYWVVSKDRS
ncbi:MAG: hypothetical protein GY800_04155 [Planctomycetes bacterium]|nr:hypothetical protein [Planctomycetota bacterium]